MVRWYNQYRGARRMGFSRRTAFRTEMGNLRSRYRRGGSGRKWARGIAGMSLPYIAGGVLGYAGPRIHPMQDLAITAAAVFPIRLPYNIQNIAKGYVFGMIARQIVPGIGGFGSGESGGSFV